MRSGANSTSYRTIAKNVDILLRSVPYRYSKARSTATALPHTLSSISSTQVFPEHHDSALPPHLPVLFLGCDPGRVDRASRMSEVAPCPLEKVEACEDLLPISCNYSSSLAGLPQNMYNDTVRVLLLLLPKLSEWRVPRCARQQQQQQHRSESSHAAPASGTRSKRTDGACLCALSCQQALISIAALYYWT